MNAILRIMGTAALAMAALSGFAQQSLDEIDRASYKAGKSPLEQAGEKMQAVGSAKSAKTPARQTLDGTWQLAADKGGKADWGQAISAKVPGSVHQALWAAGKIPNPLVGFNDTIAEQNSYKNWWMRRTFSYSANWKGVKLAFSGVANKCTVWLNGHKLGQHEGMFGGPDFDVTSLLRKGENELVVHLDSIPFLGKDVSPFASSWTKTVVANCVYGWHYAKIPTIGIWNDVQLVEVPAVAVENPFVITKSLDGEMRLEVTLTKPVARGTIDLEITPKNFKGKKQCFRYAVNNKSGKLWLDFKLKDPQLWWPNEYGRQNLYEAAVALSASGAKATKTTTSFGVRTIVMSPQPEGKRGDQYNWTFTVNGKKIFAKGADWCLIDALMDLSRDHYMKFLQPAKEQHLQLFRAWGGGLMETNIFYDLCDSLGIMVMQEWPTCWNSHLTQPMDVMRETVVRTLMRIRNHPSLALMTAGNESQNPFGEMIDMMGRASIELDGTRAFHRGEAWGGSGHNHDTHWLDLHLNNALNMQATFWGEFGMPSLPVKESMDKYMNGEEISYPLRRGSVLDHHGMTLGGWGDDMRRLEREVRFFMTPNTPEKIIMGSQLTQVMGTRRTLERSRSRWPNCTGACYYKMNDVYPGLAWASVDYYGAKKPAHYFIKRSFDPVQVAIIFDSSNLTGRDASLKTYLFDDTLSLKGKKVKVARSVWDTQMNCIKRDTVDCQPTQSVNALPDLKLTVNQLRSTMLYFKLDLLDENGRKLRRNWYIENWDSREDGMLLAPHCKLNVVQTGGKVEITNTSDKIPAAYVEVSVPGESDKLDLSDNYLWIDPGETVTVKMNTTSKVKIYSWNAE